MPDDLDQAMTREDFALVLPLIIDAVVSACSPKTEVSNHRQASIANQLVDIAYRTPEGPDRAFLAAVATSLVVA
ncbi:hypothetical protein [Ensifer canadensis]